MLCREIRVRLLVRCSQVFVRQRSGVGLDSFVRLDATNLIIAQHSQPVKEFLAQEAAGRIHLERLPGYAPELNPDEGIWRYLKRVELRNVCCAALSELRYELRLAIARLRHKVSVIKGCISHAG